MGSAEEEGGEGIAVPFFDAFFFRRDWALFWKDRASKLPSVETALETARPFSESLGEGGAGGVRRARSVFTIVIGDVPSVRG